MNALGLIAAIALCVVGFLFITLMVMAIIGEHTAQGKCHFPPPPPRRRKP